MRRILRIGVPLVLVAAVGAALLVARSLDGIVKGVIEDVGSDLLQTRVSVGSVAIDLREGRGTIRNLRVANPAGFSSDDAFSLGEITLGIDLSSITGSPIVLEEVVVSAPVALAEATTAGVNLDVLRRNVDRSSGTGREADAGEGDDEAARIRIRRFTFEGGKAKSDTTALGGKAEQIDIPGVSLRDVGGASGDTAAELGKTILSAWLGGIARAAATEQARSAAGKALDKVLGEGGKSVGDTVRGLLD
jgi:hypothetical protein